METQRRGDLRQNDAVKVVVRVRPMLAREREAGVATYVDCGSQTVTVSNGEVEEFGDHATGSQASCGGARPGATHVFSFDHVYDDDASQSEVFETTARPVVESCLEGYNGTIFAYGQTGTGKTFTQYGRVRVLVAAGSSASSVCGSQLCCDANDEERGIIPRAMEHIFSHVSRRHGASSRTRFLVRASCLQIYQEQVSDLLRGSDGSESFSASSEVASVSLSEPQAQSLAIREDPKRGVYVEGLSEFVAKSPREVYALMERASRRRATGTTRMNDVSSRSHAVFAVVVEQSESVYVDDEGVELSPEEFARAMRAQGLKRDEALARLDDRVRQTFRVGKLNLVDLAGSERVRVSGASGLRLEESKKINASLSSLGNVIAALAEKRKHVPYRDSKLTRLLEDSLGGNCRTTMLATVSPSRDAVSETLSTLKFATRAKSVTNEPRVNEDLDQKSLLRKYERELRRLRAELDERNRHVVDQRRLLELEERRRRAEEDKMAAIRALEARSLDFMREKKAKQALEERIARLTSQIVFTDDHPDAHLLLRSARRTASLHRQTPDEATIVAGARLEGSIDDVEHHQSAVSLVPAPPPERHEHPPPFRRRVADEYDDRLAELERERQSVDESKAQVARYKQLLLKQRDIMIALTQRLNERDEQIVALQDELDEYDRTQAELENKLDEKTAQCIRLERLQLEAIFGRADGEDRAVDRLAADFDAASQAHKAKAQLDDKDALLAAKEAELRALRHKLSSGDLAKVLELRDKERRAVQTIFEKKISVLVDAVDANLADNVKAAKRDLTSLKKLVHASIEALRQADAETAASAPARLEPRAEVHPAGANNNTNNSIHTARQFAAPFATLKPPRYPTRTLNS